MFKRKKNKEPNVTELAAAKEVKQQNQSSDISPVVTDHTIKELSARYASLFMIAYRRGDVSAMHITLTALTHTLHALGLWQDKKSIAEQCFGYVLQDGYPVDETSALRWLINHYFEQHNEQDESCLLNWYQSLDDEWVLRKKLREMFPEKSNSELTQLIAQEQAKLH